MEMPGSQAGRVRVLRPTDGRRTAPRPVCRPARRDGCRQAARPVSPPSDEGTRDRLLLRAAPARRRRSPPRRLDGSAGSQARGGCRVRGKVSTGVQRRSGEATSGAIRSIGLRARATTWEESLWKVRHCFRLHAAARFRDRCVLSDRLPRSGARTDRSDAGGHSSGRMPNVYDNRFPPASDGASATLRGSRRCGLGGGRSARTPDAARCALSRSVWRGFGVSVPAGCVACSSADGRRGLGATLRPSLSLGQAYGSSVATLSRLLMTALSRIEFGVRSSRGFIVL